MRIIFTMNNMNIQKHIYIYIYTISTRYSAYILICFLFGVFVYLTSEEKCARRQELGHELQEELQRFPPYWARDTQRDRPNPLVVGPT